MPTTTLVGGLSAGAVALAAVAVLAVNGVASAHADGAPSPTTSPTASPTGTPTGKATGKATAKATGKATAKAGAAAGDRTAAKAALGHLRDFQHAEWVTGPAGSAVTHDAVLGRVTAVSPTSVTVASADGTSLTFAVTDHTTVRQRAAQKAATSATIADVTVGRTVLVSGTKTSGLTALHVVVRAG
jgi:hypothetical protein